MPDRLMIQPFSEPPNAVVVVPGSKSYTNRALVLAALAEGTSTITGALVADDIEAMISCLEALGVRIEAGLEGTQLTVTGIGGALPAGPIEMNARLSGTTSRFVLPVLALGAGPYVLDGHAPLRNRPMGPIIDGLRALGAEVHPHEDASPGHLPVEVRGTNTRGGAVTVSANLSSQFVSGLLLVGPALAEGLDLTMVEATASRPYLTMTTTAMAAFGARVDQPDPNRFVVPPGQYQATTYAVEPDASTASYLFAAAALTGGRIRVEGLGSASLQGDLQLVETLGQMGADIEITPNWTEVRGTETLRGVDLDMADFPDMAPTIAAVAVFAEGPTRVRGVSLIRHHETDRIAGVVTELRRCGISAEETEDGFIIQPGTPQPAAIETYQDHRMAMAFTLLGLRVPGIQIIDPDCVAKTFPHFFEVVDSLRETDLAPQE